MHYTRVFALTIFYAVAVVAVPSLFSAEDIKTGNQERTRIASLLQIPATTVALNFAFDADLKRVAYLAVEKDEKFVVVDGHEGKRYAGYPTDMAFTSDGRIAYYVRTDDKGRNVVVVVGAKEVSLNDPMGIVIVPQNGSVIYSHWVKDSTNANKRAIVIDDKEVARFDNIGNISLSPNGEYITFQANKDNNTSNDDSLVILSVKTGKIEHEYENARHPIAFSTDGKRIGCIHEIAEKNSSGVKIRNSFKLLINGKEEGELYDEIDNVIFSPDSATVAFGARKGAQQTLVVNGKDLHWFDYVDPNLTVRPAGSPQCPMPRPSLPRCLFIGDYVSDGLGFLVSSKGEKRVIKAEDYGLHSPDGKHAAIAEPANHKQVIVDGKAGPEFAKVYLETIRFSADSKHLSYAAHTYKQGAEAGLEIVRVDVDVSE